MFQAVPVEKPRFLCRALQEDEIDRGRQRRRAGSKEQRLAFGTKRSPEEESSLIQGRGFDIARDELRQNRRDQRSEIRLQLGGATFKPDRDDPERVRFTPLTAFPR